MQQCFHKCMSWGVTLHGWMSEWGMMKPEGIDLAGYEVQVQNPAHLWHEEAQMILYQVAESCLGHVSIRN